MTEHSYPEDSRPSKKLPTNPPDTTRFCLTSSVADFRCCLICSFLHLFFGFVYAFLNSLPVDLHTATVAGNLKEKKKLKSLEKCLKVAYLHKIKFCGNISDIQQRTG